MKRDLVIIGGGAAGLAAAISAYDHGVRDIVILEKDHHLGGILNQCIHNGFGLQEFHEQLTGPEYAYRFIQEVKKRKIAYHLDTTVLSLDADKKLTYANANEGFVEVEAGAIIFAIGCFERSAGAIRLPGDRPNGIFTAGTAQRYLNMDGYLVGKRVFILGSGDIGLIMARRMRLEGAEVLGVAEIMPYSNGLNRNLVQCLNDFSIPLYLSHTVKKVIGKEQLEKVIIAQVDENQQWIEGTEKEFSCDTLLLSIGLIPSSQMLIKAGALPCPSTKSVMVNEWMETTIPGIFACGNVLHVHDLVDFVSEEARLAGQGAAHYLLNPHTSSYQMKVRAQEGISYVVPQYLNIPTDSMTITFKFRVRKPMQNAIIYLKVDDQMISQIRKPFLLPSEMERIVIETSKIPVNGKEISVEVKEQ